MIEYAGGYEPNDFNYYVDVAQQQMSVPQMGYIEQPRDSLANEILQMAIDYNAGWWIIGFAALGAIVVFKKRIRKWLLWILQEGK